MVCNCPGGTWIDHVNSCEYMRVLIGCEESQAVCIEFRKLGHEAYSCDLKSCSGGKPEWHIQGDVIQAINSTDWDFIGLHPVCTKITLSGNRHYGKGKPKHQERIDAVEWTIALWNIACKKSSKVYMENPMGAMNGDARLPKPQIIHPYYFGDEFQKQTCLWLMGLKPLLHCKENNLFGEKTHVDKGEMTVFKSGKQHPKWYADALSKSKEERQTIRSKSFPGIAKAMATQWGNLINTTP